MLQFEHKLSKCPVSKFVLKYNINLGDYFNGASCGPQAASLTCLLKRLNNFELNFPIRFQMVATYAPIPFHPSPPSENGTIRSKSAAAINLLPRQQGIGTMTSFSDAHFPKLYLHNIF